MPGLGRARRIRLQPQSGSQFAAKAPSLAATKERHMQRTCDHILHCFHLFSDISEEIPRIMSLIYWTRTTAAAYFDRSTDHGWLCDY